MRNDSDGGNILIAFLAGAVVGAAVAILTTPKTGPEVREQLRGYGARLKEGAERGVESIKEMADRVRHRGEESEETA